MTLESKIQSTILRWLKAQPGIWAIKVIEANECGCPDIIVCDHGRFVALEVKGDRGKLSPAQRLQAKRIRDAGGECYTVRSLQDCKDIFLDS